MSVEPANNNINDSRTKWYGQNGMDKMIGYTDKMVRTKWYLQNGTYKILRIRSSINPAPIDIMIFHQPRFQSDAFSFPLCAYHLFVTFGY